MTGLCEFSHDGITQAEGTALSNFQLFDGSGHVPTSYARVDGGVWVAGYDLVLGDGIDAYGASAYGDSQDKGEWPSLIASTHAIWVGYFPDDGSPSTMYHLDVLPAFSWNTTGAISPSDIICRLYPFIGDAYANDLKSELTGWFMRIFDVKVRTDGTNVWVAILAEEAVPYPYRWSNKTTVDHCRIHHANFESFVNTEPFSWDTGPNGNTDEGYAAPAWVYHPGQLGPEYSFGDYDDPGEGNSLMWQPARVTVYGGDLGGFTFIDSIDAVFSNLSGPAPYTPSGKLSGIECAASPAEPGVMHVMWSEGGPFYKSSDKVHARWTGQRINYSRWGPVSKDLDTDFYYVEWPGTEVPDELYVWTSEFILRNDHGSPAAIVWKPVVSGGSVQYFSPQAEYWDLSEGAVNVLQTADASLAPTTAESNGDLLAATEVTGQGFLSRQQYASSLYVDPTMNDTPVYLLAVRYGEASVAFLRIPCDGSDTFDYMDGTRETWYSIIPRYYPNIDGPYSNNFQSDFVSDPGNVWMLANYPPFGIPGGDVVHLDRQCLHAWEILPAFPTNEDPTAQNGAGSGYLTGQWVTASGGVPSIVTDADGNDWLRAGGNGPNLTSVSSDDVYVTNLWARICRCCLPCRPLGLHTWQTVG